MTWQRKTLGEICDSGGGEVRTGPFGSQLHESDYSRSGTPVVMPKDILDGKVSERSVARVNENHVSRLLQHQLQTGDIVFGRRGDIGRQALISAREDGWLCGTGCLRITIGKSELDPQYLHYYLRDEQVIKGIAQQAIGATMPNLNTSILRGIPVRFPEKTEQKRIASILSAYDHLIENNRRRIAILDEIARRIYEEWFVRFRFPGHQDVRTVDSQLGLVPEGWQLKRLGDEIELPYGKALKAGDREFGDVPVYGSSGVVGYHNASLAVGPGIIVGRKGNVGSVHWSESDFYPIDTVFYVRTKLPLHFTFYNLRRQNFLNNDAAVPGLSRNQAYSLPLLVPATELLCEFEEICDSFLGLARTLARKNVNLRATRDLLLPRLISGELDVSDLPEPEAAAA